MRESGDLIIYVGVDDLVGIANGLLPHYGITGTIHDFCVAAALSMLVSGSTHHVSYVDQGDGKPAGLLELAFPKGKSLKVEISWVDTSERVQEVAKLE